MKAVIWKGERVFEFGEFPKPSIGDRQVLVKVKAASICTTDFHYQEFKCVPPIVPGHEVAGQVEEIGSEVTKLKKGDRVTLDPVQKCGKCYCCVNGIEHLCLNTRHLGDTDLPGGWSEFVAIDEQNAHVIPDCLEYENACLAEPTAVCLQSYKRARFAKGGNILIMGDGTFGFIHAMIAQKFDPDNIIVAGHYDQRLARIKDKTGVITCNTHNEDLNKVVSDTVGKHSIDLVIEATGAGPVPVQSIKFLRPQGTIILFSCIWNPEILPLGLIHMKELNVLGACRSLNCYKQCIDWFADGSIDIGELIDFKVHFQNVGKAIEQLTENKKNVFKAVMVP